VRLKLAAPITYNYIICEAIGNKARGFIDPITQNIVGKAIPSNIVSYPIGLPRAKLETN
jgi:hypothetical protein